MCNLQRLQDCCFHHVSTQRGPEGTLYHVKKCCQCKKKIEIFEFVTFQALIEEERKKDVQTTS
jgi:hypothetical protein